MRDSALKIFISRIFYNNFHFKFSFLIPLGQISFQIFHFKDSFLKIIFIFMLVPQDFIDKTKIFMI